MARPKGEVLLVDNDEYSTTEIMQAQSVWVVEYQNKPIVATRTTWGHAGAVAKYLRTNFSNKAHAYRLADKLNKKFNTDEFTVREI